MEAATRLERSQRARRARVIDAVLELAREGGYDAVQVRAVSDISLVGSDTIYRYFGSRDGLIAEAVRHWVEKEIFEPAPTWPRGDTPAERLLSMLHESLRTWERAPKMLEMYVRAAQADYDDEDGLAAASFRTMTPIMASALHGVPEDYRDDVMMIVSRVCHSVMLEAAQGQVPVTELYPTLERTVVRLAQHPAMQHTRPPGWAYRASARATRLGGRRA